MSEATLLSVRPIIHYPRKAEVGKTYLMTVDLRSEGEYLWQYEDEEYPVYCRVKSDLFESKVVDDPIIILNRFGGSYGETKILLTALQEVKEGEIELELINNCGVLIRNINLACQTVTQSFSEEVLVQEAITQDKALVISQIENKKIHRENVTSNVRSSKNSKPLSDRYGTYSTSEAPEDDFVRNQIQSPLDQLDEEIIYDFIGKKARSPLDQPISEVVYNLLANKQAPSEVIASLDRIVRSEKFTGEEGLRFINRCIYTAINPLHLDGNRRDELKRLVAILRTVPEPAMSATTKKLRQVLRRYVEDEKYQSVLRQARMYESSEAHVGAVLGDLFHEYSFLYTNAGVTRDIRELDISNRQAKSASQLTKLTEGIKRKRTEKIYAMRQDLNAYIEHRKAGTLQPSCNPTHLTDEELVKGLKLFNTKRKDSFREKALRFRQRYTPGRTVIECRDDVLEYMSQPLERLPHHHRDLYQEKFHKALQDMETTNGAMRSTVIQAFKKILDSLMFVGHETHRAPRLFQKSVQAISPCGFSAILLNLVLGCPMILHKLEERLTSLYIRYEKQPVKSLTWLVQFFDYMHLALVMNFRYLMSHKAREESQIPQSVIWP